MNPHRMSRKTCHSVLQPSAEVPSPHFTLAAPAQKNGTCALSQQQPIANRVQQRAQGCAIQVGCALPGKPTGGETQRDSLRYPQAFIYLFKRTKPVVFPGKHLHHCVTNLVSILLLKWNEVTSSTKYVPRE